MDQRSTRQKGPHPPHEKQHKTSAFKAGSSLLSKNFLHLACVHQQPPCAELLCNHGEASLSHSAIMECMCRYTGVIIHCAYIYKCTYISYISHKHKEFMPGARAHTHKLTCMLRMSNVEHIPHHPHLPLGIQCQCPCDVFVLEFKQDQSIPKPPPLSFPAQMGHIQSKGVTSEVDLPFTHSRALSQDPAHPHPRQIPRSPAHAGAHPPEGCPGRGCAR